MAAYIGSGYESTKPNMTGCWPTVWPTVPRSHTVAGSLQVQLPAVQSSLIAISAGAGGDLHGAVVGAAFRCKAPGRRHVGGAAGGAL